MESSSRAERRRSSTCPDAISRHRSRVEQVTVVLVESPYGSTAREIAALRSACPRSLERIDEFSGIAAWRVTPNDPCVPALDKRFRAASASSRSRIPSLS